jgi:hypothetical protein
MCGTQISAQWVMNVRSGISRLLVRIQVLVHCTELCDLSGEEREIGFESAF